MRSTTGAKNVTKIVNCLSNHSVSVYVFSNASSVPGNFGSGDAIIATIALNVPFVPLSVHVPYAPRIDKAGRMRSTVARSERLYQEVGDQPDVNVGGPREDFDVPDVVDCEVGVSRV